MNSRSASVALDRSPAIRRQTLSGIARTSICVAVHKVKLDAKGSREYIKRTEQTPLHPVSERTKNWVTWPKSAKTAAASRRLLGIGGGRNTSFCSFTSFTFCVPLKVKRYDSRNPPSSWVSSDLLCLFLSYFRLFNLRPWSCKSCLILHLSICSFCGISITRREPVKQKASTIQPCRV